jgi:hypothetical protein
MGKGDIQVALLSGHRDKCVAVAFSELTKSYPIGTPPPISDPNYGNFVAALIFNKPESIDVVIKMLTDARKNLVKMLEESTNA